jgi:mannose-1-phosphate guanylyltransferase
MRSRIIAYLLIALFVLTIWAHVIIAREHAATAQAYADATEAMWDARIQSLRAHAMLTEARETYKDALRSCNPEITQSTETRKLQRVKALFNLAHR